MHHFVSILVYGTVSGVTHAELADVLQAAEFTWPSYSSQAQQSYASTQTSLKSCRQQFISFGTLELLTMQALAPTCSSLAPSRSSTQA
jgi:hypothetical protein